MKRKIKKFFEDFIIVVVLISIIYGSYSYIFDDSIDNFESNSIIVQTSEEPKQEIKELTQDEAIKDVITDENPDNEKEHRVPPEFIQNSIDENSNKIDKQLKEEHIIERKEIEKIATKQDIFSKKLNLIENSKLEKSASQEEQIEKEKFYKNLKDKIYTNIDSNLNKSIFNEPVFAEIRVTILKDGRYEQLILSNGNMEFFNAIKSSIANSFPIEINPNLKNIFPRYYRLKIEFN